MDDLLSFRAEAIEAGIPVDQIDIWTELVRFCVVLMGTDGPPAGYLGGRPLLPADTTWPDDLDFIAGIDCAALPREGTDITLPADGHLLFFLENDLLEMKNAHRVLHVPAGTVVSERPAPAGVPEYPRTDLVAHLAFSTPDFDFGTPDEDFDWEERVPRGEDLNGLAQRYWRINGWPSGTIVVGGYGVSSTSAPEALAAYIGRGAPDRAEPDEEALNIQAFHDWVPLAQMSHPNPTKQHEFYTPRYMIKRTDLAAGRFDKVVAVADFSE